VNDDDDDDAFVHYMYVSMWMERKEGKCEGRR
jgi:hypothetical protein